MKITFEQAKMMWRDLRYFQKEGYWENGCYPQWLVEEGNHTQESFPILINRVKGDILLAFAKELGL